jgi:transcriptional regulator with XRE-family HTH domain
MTRVSQSIKNAVIIRALRNAFGYSQISLATKAGCSRPTINPIECLDKSSPRSNTIDELIQVFRELGVEVQINDEEILLKFTKKALLNATNLINLSSEA